ncbi:YegP family protein [Flavobacterium sp. JLP]|uniref:YegP family protein n=1 Tax=unclassified Flavobacterium TaxID=196869 RepID=UPI0004939BBE|nr:MULTISPECIES: YegP family protein [unclassified Flavobacterium]MBF4494240.1 YegP family protein [Flavobacterium sp. MR2016-29]MBF4507658.1 YegP family protein [Flavobacterium sp. JLP]
MGTFVITKKTEAKFQVQLKSKTGKVLLCSQEYSSKISCKKAIEKFRAYAQDKNSFQKRTTVQWELYFYLKTAQGKPIATSINYNTYLAREKAINTVKKIAPIAAVEDHC